MITVKKYFMAISLILGAVPLMATSGNKKTTKLEEAKVLKCHDGDTCRVKIKNKEFSIRIWGIDAPEKKQTFGASSQRYLESLLKGKSVILDCEGESYSRKVCKVQIGDKDVSEELIKLGYAWEYKKFTKGKFSHYEEKARQQKLGLWYQEKPLNPTCFRHPKAKSCEKKN